MTAVPHRRGFWMALAALTAILLLAAFLRLYRLGEVPPALFFDEAGQGVDSLEILAGRRPIFFQRSITKEPLYVYWTVPFVALLERGPWAVRLPAALVGIATVPAVFFLVRELLAEEGRGWATALGLLTAGLLAGSFWAVLVNRMAFRVNMVPLMTALAFALIWRTYRLGGVKLALAGGAALGLCFYTYLSARFAYPLALIMLGALALTAQGRMRLHARRRELVWMAVTCVLVMLPLGFYFLQHPDDFLRRAAMVTSGDSAEAGYSMQLAGSVVGQLGMFGGPGDPELRHNIPHRSILAPWLALCFWLGVGAALWRVRRPGRLMALLWLGIMLLPAMLSVSDPRHMLRAFSVLPVVYFFPSLALGDGWRWMTARWPARRGALTRLALLLAACLILLEAVITGRAYFDRWANLPDLPRAFRAMDTAIAEEINAAPAGVGYIVALAPLWRGLAGNYTLDYLIERPEAVLQYYPDAPEAAEQVAAFLARPDLREVRIVAYTWAQDAAADPYRLTALLAEQVGAPLATREDPDYRVESFALSHGRAAPIPADFEAATADFASAGRELTLTGWRRLAAEAGGSGVVNLRWQMDAVPAQPLRVSLRLLDDLGQPVGQSDSFLFDPANLPAADVPLLTYHPVTAAPGTPPGSYQLELIVYAAESGRLPLVRAEPAPRDAVVLGAAVIGEAATDRVDFQPAFAWPEATLAADGLSLLGAEFADDGGRPGLPLDVTLAWQVDHSLRPQELCFMLDDVPVGQAMLTLPQGGPWRTTHRLQLPAGLAQGNRLLQLTVDAGASVAIGTVNIAGVEPVPPLPQAIEFADDIRLLGADYVTEEGAAVVTLAWERTDAGESIPDYTVFVHIVDASGQIIVQADGQPAGGLYPTSSWPADTPIVDSYVIPLPHAIDAEKLCTRVGLYLSGSGQRLPLLAGGDEVALPSCTSDSP